MGENAIADLIDYLSANGPPDNMKESECQLILRALRLLAAAEANDGSTPETDTLVRFEFESTEHPFPAHALLAMIQLARTLEQRCNGLAARVQELEAKVRLLNIFKGCAMDAIEAHEITNQGDHDVIGALIGIAARSK